MEIEVWKDIPEYEGLYQVSNFGKIKSLPRNTTKGGILKPSKSKDSYLKVTLTKDGKVKYFLVHRLVALIFIPNDNPTEKTQVNHIDENPSNNHVSNLNWVTPKENTNYDSCIERRSKTKSIPIIQLDLQENFIREWDSATTASRELNINKSNIGSCLKGRYKHCGGFIWMYKEI